MVGAEHAQPRRRRIGVPVTLFALTCLSTFWAGCAPANADLVFNWFFTAVGLMNRDLSAIDAQIRDAILANWHNGLIYMGCVLAILFFHEMGHFLMTLRYRIAASLPYFLPVPFTPIGTMGAVISMDGLSADRRQIFDIGIAGPLAGLVVAIPVTWYGVTQLDLNDYQPSMIDSQKQLSVAELSGEEIKQYKTGFGYDMPWAVRAMISSAEPKGYRTNQVVDKLPTNKMNPYLMAGWVGLLITGLNMMPISQLDGGHVIYALFGKRAHVLARMFLFLAIFFVVLHFERVFIWTVMLLLVTLMGTDHPPTADDRVNLGPGRTVLGLASLLIPFACFPFYGLWPLAF